MARFAAIVALLLLSVALLTSAQGFGGNFGFGQNGFGGNGLSENRDFDGCVVFGNGMCQKMPSFGMMRGGRSFGQNGICQGECINTGRRGADRCECLDIHRGWRRIPAFGWNRMNGWGNGK